MQAGTQIANDILRLAESPRVMVSTVQMFARWLDEHVVTVFDVLSEEDDPGSALDEVYAAIRCAGWITNEVVEINKRLGRVADRLVAEVSDRANGR